MTNEVVNKTTGEIVTVTTGSDWTPAQIDLMRRQVVPKDITDDEFKVFLHVARHKQLDPFRSQIYAVKRSGKMTIQTGIDGYMSLAARTGEFVGMDEPRYLHDDSKNLISCSVAIFRLVAGKDRMFAASARLDEYAQPSNPIWKKMPYAMLAKCARALALRIAFPDELGGIYTTEEMQQADNVGGLQQPSPIDAEAIVSTPQHGHFSTDDSPFQYIVEKEMQSKYGTSAKPNKCGFCGKYHIVAGDRIVLVNNKWGCEDCIAVDQEEQPDQKKPTATVPPPTDGDYRGDDELPF